MLSEKADFRNAAKLSGDIEAMQFSSCEFSGVDLSGVRFIDTSFTDCNFSMANIVNSSFQDCIFNGCKMLGLRFDLANPFGLALEFRSCVLSHSSFYKVKLKKTMFRDCTMHEVDFSAADLSESLLENCDLLNAAFDNTTLEKCDLRSAINFQIDPERNKMKKAKLSMEGLPGLLTKYQIQISR